MFLRLIWNVSDAARANLMGRPRTTTRLVAEDCLHLWIHQLPLGKQTLTWQVDGESIAMMGYERDADFVRIPAQPLSLRPVWAIEAHYLTLARTMQWSNKSVQQWFLCSCGHRVAKLYLAPTERQFRCRHCLNLTYRSAQTHDARENHLLRHPEELEKALRDPRRQMLALKAALRVSLRQKRGGFGKNGV